MQIPTRLALILALAAPTVSTQDPARRIPARLFAPADYTTEFRVDMAAVVDSGLWDLVERSPARIPLAAFRSFYGFDLADLDRVLLAQSVEPAPEGAEPWQSVHHQVWILEGPPKVGLARLGDELLAEFPVAETRGGVAMRRAEQSPHEIASPAPGAIVLGWTYDFAALFEGREPRKGLISQVLDGDRRGGAPVPDLMALSAAPRALLVMAAVPSAGMPLDASNMQPFPSDWFVDGDLPQGFRLQIVRAPGADDRLLLEVMVRFASKDGGGAEAMAEGFAAQRSAWAAEPRMRGLAAALAAVETRIEGRDLIASLDLGTEREHGARLSPLIAALMQFAFVGVSDVVHEVVVEAAEAEAEPVPEPVAPPPVEPRRRGS